MKLFLIDSYFLQLVLELYLTMHFWCNGRVVSCGVCDCIILIIYVSQNIFMFVLTYDKHCRRVEFDANSIEQFDDHII